MSVNRMTWRINLRARPVPVDPAYLPKWEAWRKERRTILTALPETISTRKVHMHEEVRYQGQLYKISGLNTNGTVNLRHSLVGAPKFDIPVSALEFKGADGMFPPFQVSSEIAAPAAAASPNPAPVTEQALSTPEPQQHAPAPVLGLTAKTLDLQPHPRNAVIYGEEDVSELVDQIVRSNWIKAIVVNPANQRIVSGHRRWLAAKALGLSTVPVEYRTFNSDVEELEALLLENASREKTPEQKVREADVWTEIEAPLAQQRQAQAAQQTNALLGRKTETVTPNLAEASKGETRAKVAEKVGMKRSTYEKAKSVVKAADALSYEGKVDQAKALLDHLNNKSVDAAYKTLVSAARQAERQQQQEALRQAAAQQPQALSTYAVLLIDPPWEFQVYSKETGHGRSAESHYQTLTLADMKGLPMHRLMAEDCAVFLWVTWPTLVEAIELGTAWGLTYKTCAFNWVKLNKRQTEKPFTGMGYWARANSEICLLFTKGAPKRQAKDVSQALVEWTDTETVATPIGEHSEKPTAIYERIEALIDGPYCEVFARQKRAGWAAIGNEIDGRDIREVLK